MGYVLLAIYVIFMLISPPALVVFIILYVNRGKEIKKLKSQIKFLQSGGVVQSKPSVTENQNPVKVIQPQPQLQPVAVKPVQSQPKPQARPVAQKKKNDGISSINITFGVGVLLLTVVGAFFITASWSFMSAPVRCGVLLFVAAIVFLLSFISGQLLKLSQTGFSFFSLGTFLLPIIIFGIGGFKLFDSGFTIQDNPGLVGAVAFLCFAVAGFIGSRIYKSNFHMGISYFGMTWMVIFVAVQTFRGYYSAPLIAIGVLAVAALLINRFKPGIKGMEIYSIIMSFVSLISIFSLFINEEAGATVAMVLATISMTLLYKFKWQGMSIFVPIMMMLTLVSGYSVMNDYMDVPRIATMLFFLVGSIVVYVLMEILKGRTISCDIVCWSFIVGFALLRGDNPDIGIIILSFVMMIVASAIMVRGVLGKNSSAIRYVEAIFASASIPMIALCLEGDEYVGITMVAISTVLAVASIYGPKFSTVMRDGPIKLISYSAALIAGTASFICYFIDYGKVLGVIFAVTLMTSIILGILSSMESRKDAKTPYSRKNPLFIVLGILLTTTVPFLIFPIIDTAKYRDEGSTLAISLIAGIYLGVMVLSKVMVLQGNKRFKKYFPVFGLVLAIESGIAVFTESLLSNSWASAAFAVVLIAILYIIKDTRTAIIPIISLLISINKLEEIYNLSDVWKMVTSLIAAIVLMAVGRLLSSRKLFSGKVIDWLSILSILYLIHSVNTDIEMSLSIFFIATGVYFANFLRKEKKGFDRFALSLTAISVGFAFSFQKLVTIPQLFIVEYHLIVMLAVVFILRTVIKPFGKDAMRYIWIAFFALAIFVEATSAAMTSELLDLLVVGVTAIVMFVYSFIRKEKSWFVLSMVTLCGIAVYLAVSFGNTWTWLIYLFVSGLILITIAMLNEYGKRKAEKEGDKSKKRFFSEWIW